MPYKDNNTTIFLKINKDIFMPSKNNTTTVFLKINKDIFML
jgi:hypothetical protein